MGPISFPVNVTVPPDAPLPGTAPAAPPPVAMEDVLKALNPQGSADVKPTVLVGTDWKTWQTVKLPAVLFPSGFAVPLSVIAGYLAINGGNTRYGWQKFCVYWLQSTEQGLAQDADLEHITQTTPEVLGDASWYHNRPGGTSPKIA